MKNKDFDKQWNDCKEVYKKAKCPLDSNELNEFIGKALSMPQYTIPGSRAKSKKVWLWSLSAAAACMAMLFVVNTVVANPTDEFQDVTIDGQEIIFACNNGCSPENTVEMFNQIIQ